MDGTALKTAFDNFNGLTALVVGDVMIDAYLVGDVERISPEAPVPVVHVTHKENRLGGAANVVLNLAALGAKPVICAVSGDDAQGDTMANLFKSGGMTSAGIVRIHNRPTTVKTRVISQDQHVVRVDEESLEPLNSDEETLFIARVKSLIESEKPDVIIFEDYNKGVLTPKVIKETISMAKAHNIPTTVDPKKDNFFAYKGVTLYKPNLKELMEGLKVDIDKSDLSTLVKAVNLLEAEIDNEISLITLSELGVFVQGRGVSTRVPAHPRKILDVSGAGDTVISVASLCLALGLAPEAIAELANLSGGLVCEKVGVVPIDKELLLEEALNHLTKN